MDDPYKTPKSDLAKRAAKMPGRTAAQIAFDRCMIFLGAAVIVPMLLVMLPELRTHRIPAAILYSALIAWWVRSLVGVFATWNEPDARIIRFSALGVLVLAGLPISALVAKHFVS